MSVANLLLGWAIASSCSLTGGPVGLELWSTDGTPAGTTQIASPLIPAGRTSRTISAAVLGNQLYFSYTELNSNDIVLAVTDGTTAGTRMVTSQATGGPAVSGPMQALGNRLIFMTSALFGSNPAIWSSDGTAAGTTQIRSLGLVRRESFALQRLGNELVFFVRATTGEYTAHATDGTVAGTRQISPTQFSEPEQLTSFATRLYFISGERNNGRLFRLDSSSVTEVMGLNVTSLVAAQSRLFMSTATAELWVSDGTTPGTRLVDQLGGRIEELSTQGDRAFFAVDNLVVGTEPWTSNATVASTRLLANLLGPASTETGSRPSHYAETDFGTVFFARSPERFPASSAFFSTDGTETGTRPLFDARLPAKAGVLGTLDHFVFNGYPQGSSVGAGVVRRSDGTAAGTVTVAQRWLQPGVAVRQGDAVLMFVEDPNLGAPGFALLRVRGAATTVALALPTSITDEPNDPIAVGGDILFTAGDAATGRELWSVQQGRIIVDIRPGPASGLPAGILGSPLRVAFGNRMLFTADDGVSGLEPWITDGTAAGTMLLADLEPGRLGSNARDGIVVGDVAYFVAVTGFGSEVWRTDGTAAGTRRVTDISPGAQNSTPGEFTLIGSNLLFAATDASFERQLWSINTATEAVTRVTSTTRPGPTNVVNLVKIGNRRAYFIAAEARRDDPRIWVTDGTPSGTLRFSPVELAPTILHLRRDGQILLTAALSSTPFDLEPWILDPGAVAQTGVAGCGTAVLRADDPVLGQTLIAEVSGASPGTAGLAALGFPGRIDLPSGCQLGLRLGGPLAVSGFTVGAGGSAAVSYAIPASPALAGFSLSVQALVGPSGGPFAGFDVTNGVLLRLGR